MYILKIIAVLIFSFLINNIGHNQEIIYKYWIGFRDKANSDFSLSKPEEFLSQRAIERRQTQNISLDLKDLLHLIATFVALLLALIQRLLISSTN